MDRRRRARLRRGRSRPTTCRPTSAEGPDAIAGDQPFIMQADGRGWLFVPQRPRGRPAARRTTSRTSRRSRTRSTRSARTRARQQLRAAREPATTRSTASPARSVYPYVDDDLPADRAPHGRRDVALAAVPRRAAAGDVLRGAARSSPPSAGLEHGGWATIVTARDGDRGARAGHRADQAARRSRAARVHQVGLPYHWGTQRARRPATRRTTCFALVLDPNVHIQEVEGGHLRHPAGPAPARAGAAELVESLRARGRRRAPSPESRDVTRAGRELRRRGAGSASASSPTRRSASAARRARSRARSGTSSPRTGSASRASRTTTRRRSARTRGGTSPSSSSASRCGVDGEAAEPTATGCAG